LVGEGDDARLRGDADYDALLDVASAITPVPGGVGPVTTAILLRTAAELAEGRA
jgi:methylenetetrahydrofolate dehydrogenase (NADP+)/methenyltetrahydrofolate cyclohydrolase